MVFHLLVNYSTFACMHACSTTLSTPLMINSTRFFQIRLQIFLFLISYFFYIKKVHYEGDIMDIKKTRWDFHISMISSPGLVNPYMAALDGISL